MNRQAWIMWMGIVLVLVLVVAFGCSRPAAVEGPGGRRLVIDGPGEVRVTQGEVAEVKVRITRENVSSPVTLKLANLPVGVRATDSGTRFEGNEGVLHIQADQNAALVEKHGATITAIAVEGLSATQELRITIQSKD